MKKNTKILIAVCCVLAILVTSVIGTIAYLTETTDEVINTFVVGKLLEDNTKFILKEHQAFDGVDGSVDTVKDGIYTLDTSSEVTSNTYTIVPGVSIPKDPFVSTSGEELVIDAYVFVEVVNKLPNTFTVNVDTGESGSWTQLAGYKGSHGGNIYYLSQGKIAAGTVIAPTYIIKNNTVAVSNAEISLTAGTNDTLSFYGYMIQAAGFGGETEIARIQAAAAALGCSAD